MSASVLAKSYRLIRGVLNTAVDPDRIINRNPCNVPGADRESPDERPVLTVAQVFQIADLMPDRWRLMILLAGFASLRWGEVTALRRQDVAADATWLRVTRAFVDVPGQGLLVGPPKSRAGVREVILPAAIRVEVVDHLRDHVEGDQDALLFTGRKGGALRRPNFHQAVKWPATLAKAGMPGVHFHDLRHAGNIMASKAGMSTKDLMARMGHDDMRAALIYQRSTSDADARIADTLSGLVDEYRRKGTDSGEGT